MRAGSVIRPPDGRYRGVLVCEIAWACVGMEAVDAVCSWRVALSHAQDRVSRTNSLHLAFRRQTAPTWSEVFVFVVFNPLGAVVNGSQATAVASGQSSLG